MLHGDRCTAKRVPDLDVQRNVLDHAREELEVTHLAHEVLAVVEFTQVHEHVLRVCGGVRSDVMMR